MVDIIKIKELVNKLSHEVNKGGNNIEIGEIRKRNKKFWSDMPSFEEGQQINPFANQARKLQCELCSSKNYRDFYFIESKITCQKCLDNLKD